MVNVLLAVLARGALDDSVENHAKRLSLGRMRKL
jgi:hypothetical protein